MKTRSTLIALAVAASALTGIAATASQAAVIGLGATTTVAIGFRDHGGRDNRGGDWRGGWDNRGGRQDDRARMIEGRIRLLQDRIQDGRRNGGLSRREAFRLQGRLDEVASLKRSYERSGYGLNGQEAATINARLDDLTLQVRGNRHDGNRW